MANTRNLVIRDLRQAKDRLDKNNEYFIRSGTLYEQTHPDIYGKFCMLIAANETLKNMIDQVAEEI